MRRSRAALHTLHDDYAGDSSARAVDVYVPAGHDRQGLPHIVDFVGFTSSGLSHTNWVGLPRELVGAARPAGGNSACRLSSSPFRTGCTPPSAIAIKALTREHQKPWESAVSRREAIAKDRASTARDLLGLVQTKEQGETR